MGIAVALGLIVVLLAIPVELSFKITHVNRVEGCINIRWLFGLVRFRADIPGTYRAEKTPPRRSSKKRTKGPRTPGKRKAPSNLLPALRQAAFRRRVYRLAKDLLRAAHARNLLFHLRIGLGDPADTGRLWIIIGPIAAFAANIRDTIISIEPEFTDTVFELKSHGEFRLMPLHFIGLLLAFILSPPALRAWRTIH